MKQGQRILSLFLCKISCVVVCCKQQQELSLGLFVGEAAIL
jgi:hypothetical protein